MQIKVIQRDLTDCGAACLVSVAAFYKANIPVARIRQMAGTDKKGTNVLGLVEAASKIGFLAKGVKGDWESLFKIPKPAIAHMLINKVLYHYVVLLKTTEKYIEIMDPADGGIHKVKHEDFKKQWTGVLIIIAKGEKILYEDESESNQYRFLNLIRPHTTVFIQALIGAMVFSVLGLGMSVYLGKLIDHVLPGGNLKLLNLLGITMVIIIILRVILSYFQTLFVTKIGQKIDATLILGYYQHILSLPQTFFDNMRTGEIISRIGDAVKIRVFINEVTISFVINIFILLVSFVMMLFFYSKLALLTVIIIPLYALIFIVSDRLNRRVQRKVMERAADLEAQLVESLNSAGTIKQFGLENYANFKTETRFVGLLEIIYKSALNGIFTGLSSGLLSQVFSLVILWAGAGFAIGNKITVGELLSFYSVVGYFTGPVVGIIGFNRTWQDAKIAADRLFEIFDLETDDTKSRIDLKPENIGDITFEKVNFRYGTRTNVFESLDLTIRKGQVTAIVGESGSGKTTLVSLLQNLYLLQSGNIRIGGFDIRHFTNKSIRQCIGVVPQKINLFAGSIVENIAVGEIYPDMERIIEICNRLGMVNFIEEMPQGFNTYLGENGASLSGGQKQRIAIARALYRKPEIFILDEATSSLDSVAESYVKKTLEFLKSEGRTTLIIAHRFSTISLADKIVVLEKGSVVQEGKLKELISKEGRFREMWIHQTTEISQDFKM